MTRSVLSGVTDRDSRDVIQQMITDGWLAAKTNGGHIKLTHPEAAAPVFTASTPSCHRTADNLKATARRVLNQGRASALKGSTSAVAMTPAGFQQSMEKYETGMTRNRKSKPRWDERRRQESLKQALPITPARSEDKPATPAAVPTSAVTETAPAPVKLTLVQANVAEAPVASAAKTQDVAAEGPLAAPALAPAPAPAPKAAAPRRTRAKKVVLPGSVPVAKVAPPARRAVEAGSVHAPKAIDAGVLALAMRIQSGEFKGLAITAEMVGKTLWFAGESVLTGPSAATLPVPVEPAPEEPRRPRGRPREPELGNHLLQAIDGEWRPFREIMDRFNENRKEAFTRSRMEVLRYHLKLLMKQGVVERCDTKSLVSTYRRTAR